MGSKGFDLHEAVLEGQSLSDLVNDNVKLQQRLTQKQLKADDVDYLLNNNSNTIRDNKACLHSLSGRGAGTWVSTILSRHMLYFHHTIFVW